MFDSDRNQHRAFKQVNLLIVMQLKAEILNLNLAKAVRLRRGSAAQFFSYIFIIKFSIY